MKQHNKLMAVLSLLVLLPPANLSAIQSAQPQRKSPGAMKQNDNLNSLPAYVEEIMRRLPVTPGLAVAVVRGDRVIFARGFGYRDLKAKLPVTPQTAFYIASTTKSFTGTALKLLADEGKIDLDAPVKTYLPGLTLKAPLSTEQISLRDLLTHRSGISNEPINFRTAYTGQHDAETISNLLANYTTPVPPAFRYSNIGYIVAAYAAERATGEKWQQLTERKLIAPLGLNHTTCYASKARAGANFALPYLAEKDDFTELPYKEDATMHAAGGMVSSAEDLAKWLVVNMNGGRYEGKQIIPARSLEEILSPQVDQKRTFYKFERYAYGLGWNIGTYKGDKFVHCFGDFPGFRPHVSFMPEHDLGVVVLANESRDAIFLPDLIACDIYDYLLRRQPLQVKANAGVEEYAANLKKDRDERSKRAAAENERGKGAPPTLELAAYAGAYENPEFGKIVVAVENNRLVARFGVLTSTLVHSKGDSFEITLLDRTDRLNFKTDAKGGVNALTMMGKTFAKVQPT